MNGGTCKNLENIIRLVVFVNEKICLIQGVRIEPGLVFAIFSMQHWGKGKTQDCPAASY